MNREHFGEKLQPIFSLVLVLLDTPYGFQTDPLPKKHAFRHFVTDVCGSHTAGKVASGLGSWSKTDRAFARWLTHAMRLDEWRIGRRMGCPRILHQANPSIALNPRDECGKHLPRSIGL